MPQYSYTAKSGPQELKTGLIQAENQDAAVKRLRQDGLFPVSISEAASGQTRRLAAGRPMRAADLTAFTRQLSDLVRSGFPLATALSTLISQTQHAAMRRLVQDIHEGLQKGATFSQALQQRPDCFSQFYVNMCQIGEATGKLDQTLERLADFREKQEELAGQVRSALTYPGFLLFTGAVTLFVLMAFFIPRLVSLFEDMEQALPVPTMMIMRASDFMRQFWWLVLIVCGLIVLALRANYRIERNRLAVDRFLLSIPLLKDILLKIEISRLTYAMAVLLANGLSMLDSLNVVALSVDNRFLRSRIASFPEKITRGQSLSSCFQTEKIFPPVLSNMAAVGEESGNLTEMLSRIAVTFEREVNRNLKTAVTLIEPILIILIGGIIVLMVAAILLPIFQTDFFAS